MICHFDDGLTNQVVRAQLQRSAKETWFPKEETGKGEVLLESVDKLLTFNNHWKGWDILYLLNLDTWASV